MILIVSFEENEHVAQVRRHLKVESVVVDTAWIPSAMALDARFSRDADIRCLILPSGRRLDLRDVGAVWYRRIKPYGLHPDLADETARLFAWSETNEALLGFWYSIDGYWMNPPTADEVALRKIRQLQVARRLGLSIPDTLVTNDPQSARGFIDAYGAGHVVRKAFRNIVQAPRETARLREGDLALLESVRYAPVTFQRFVPAVLDLRVTIIEHDIFAAAIRSEPAFEADYRRGLGSATVAPYTLPDDVAGKLLQLMQALNLSFGAIDMRVTPEGEHVFLEVNPAGEFLFISQRTGQAIPQAIAAALERHDRSARPN